MRKRRWHYPSLKLAVETFLAQHKPKAFTSRSIEKEVAKWYHILSPIKVGNNNQRRLRNISGVLKMAIPLTGTVESQYIRKIAGRNGVEMWNGTTLTEGKVYYKLKES